METLFVLIIKAVGVLGCIGGGLFQIHKGFILYNEGRSSSEKSILKIKDVEFSLESSGALIMGLAFFWAFAATLFNPSIEQGDSLTKIANNFYYSSKIITASNINNDEKIDFSLTDYVDTFKLAASLHESQELLDVWVQGKPSSFLIKSIEPKLLPGSSTGTLAVSVFFPEINRTEQLQYIPIRHGETVSFLPLDRRISNAWDSATIKYE